jgi:ADP-heptose:LPS heptosyltransferase
LGDLVLTTPLFRALKRSYPTARVSALVLEELTPLLATNRDVDEIIPVRQTGARWLPARIRRLWSAVVVYFTRLFHRRFDLAICPRWDIDENFATMLCALTNAMRRVGYTSQATPAKARLNWGFDAAFDIVLPPGEVLHEADRSVAVVRALGGEGNSARPEIRVTDSDRRVAGRLLQYHDAQQFLIALGIGARAMGRRWPVERYARLVRALGRRWPVEAVIVCAEYEEKEAAALAKELLVRPFVLCGEPLRSVCAVLEQCDLFVGNDSGAAHLAAAMSCPTVVVSRHPRDGAIDHPNSPARFAPRGGGRVIVVQPTSGMGSCKAFCRETEPHCILQVTVDEVLTASMKLLQESRLEADRAHGRSRSGAKPHQHAATSQAIREA